MCFSCAAFVLFCAALTASFATGFNTFLGALLFALAVIVALIDVLIIQETLFSSGNMAESQPTDNEAVLRLEEASSSGLELDVAATIQAEDAVTAADEKVANDVRSPTDGENASDMAHEENTEHKFIAIDAVPQPTNDEPVSHADDANFSDDESDVGETTESEDQSDTEHAADEENADNDEHRSTDDQYSNDLASEAIDVGKFTDLESHEEVEVGNAGYGETGAGVEDDAKKETAQSSDEDEDELGFELVDIAEV